MLTYIGIDFGTSGARAAVIDQNQRLLAMVSCGFTATAAQDWASSWQQMLFELIEKIPETYRQQARAIAINGTSSTVLLCDGAGHSLTEPLLYNDGRGIEEMETLRSLFAQPRYRHAPCQNTVLSTTSTLVKVLWWSRQPFFSQVCYLMHQADWLGFLLHGKLGISDYHNSLKLGYDVAALCYPEWMEAFPALLPLLPKVVPPGTVVGTVQAAISAQLRLSPNCLVCAGTTDSIAAFLASEASSPGEAVTSLGSTLVLKLLSQTPVENQQYGIYSHRLGDLWLVGGASNTGGAVLQKFFTPAELECWSADIPTTQASPLDYYPLTQPGERFPINDPQLSPRLQPQPDNPVEFLHGLLESMARIEARGYQLLQDLGATSLDRVYTAGGGAANPAWTAIRARHLGVPVRPSKQTEASYGTALLGKVGLSNFVLI